MKLLASILAIALWVSHVRARFVFAHFMVGNVPQWTQANWEADIQYAKDAKLDAFVLNMAESDPNLYLTLDKAFAAANAKEFKLFFSFDYAGGTTPGGSWRNKATVINLINKWKNNGAYWKYAAKGYKPLVSTFEGPGQAADWGGASGIKALTGCFFIPSYSSLGANDAMKTGVVDGLFSWAGWPAGNENMNTYVDESYRYYLAGKEYMMPVSPWFYTNMPGFNKNWLWRGDDLWWDRWRDVMVMKPAFVQIISWNDWGESHYIGPLRPGTYGAFTEGKAPFNYAIDMPHDGWRLFLPYLVDSYRAGKGTVYHEGLVIWARRNAKNACSDGLTTGNTASQLLYEFSPLEIVADRIFFSALMGYAGNTRWVSITVGGTALVGEFSKIPDGGNGVYHGSVAFGSLTGPVTATLRRDGITLAYVAGSQYYIAGSCSIQNWNAWVGYDKGAPTPARLPVLSIDEQGCVEGGGKGGFGEICQFTCKYDYCPPACHCTKLGKKLTRPAPTTKIAYPMAGRGSSWIGLCTFACNLDLKYCAAPFCSLTPSTLVEPTVSPFLPPACRGGTSRTGGGADVEICKKACEFGHCPIHVCKCTATGALILSKIDFPNTKCRLNDVNNQNPDFKNICRFLGERGRCVAPCFDPDTIPTTTSRTPTPTPTPIPGDTCDPLDRMWTPRPAGEPLGEHFPQYLFIPETAGSSLRQYITIVNMTPYLFKYRVDQSHSEQMVAFDFFDIPPGHSRQCVMEYGGGNTPVDQNGEAYYDIVGTNKKFAIWARNNLDSDYIWRTTVDLDGMGLGRREYEDPNPEVPVTFVITGSETYGKYYHSLNFGTTDAWMTEIWDVIKDRRLKHITMPGSHDSGMSRIQDPSDFGTVLNSRNQALNTFDQLKVGSRWFDLRVVLYGTVFYTAHVTDERASVLTGAVGESFDNVIKGLNDFTTANPGEVIFLWFKYLTYYPQPNNGEVTEKRWDQATMDAFYGQLRRINGRCGNNILTGDTKFQERPLKDFKTGNRGCVVIILDGQVRAEVTKLSIVDGIYDVGYLARDDNWSETMDEELLVSRQVDRWQQNRAVGAANDKFLISQWLITMTGSESALGTTGLQLFAIWLTNPALYWAGFRGMNPESYPNVLMQDYVGVLLNNVWSFNRMGSEIRIFAMGINLFLASDNCAVNGRKHPLKKARVSAARQAAPWNGVIFANGTVLDNPPPGFNPWRQKILKKGTKFANGTILQEDRYAPNWDAPDPWANTTILSQQVATNRTAKANRKARGFFPIDA